jgi:hypothetical protein
MLSFDLDLTRLPVLCEDAAIFYPHHLFNLEHG